VGNGRLELLLTIEFWLYLPPTCVQLRTLGSFFGCQFDHYYLLYVRLRSLDLGSGYFQVRNHWDLHINEPLSDDVLSWDSRQSLDHVLPTQAILSLVVLRVRVPPSGEEDRFSSVLILHHSESQRLGEQRLWGRVQVLEDLGSPIT